MMLDVLLAIGALFGVTWFVQVVMNQRIHDRLDKLEASRGSQKDVKK
jgi:hypothetical protein